ncbi:NACHT, LRR and PYD domains-containing protein 12-like [Chiloscyllium plagiosum]|uniref:NACHT, LRR and PYD domains-containing protein 12-like n=1 Tax=Chiloscyllium plagiosum TaxID=36176 RepID=UPI001CB87803|nr:NACHT, LRR and PYD domains-containing protein 12-like [Chiloscyllium plagiosum]
MEAQRVAETKIGGGRGGSLGAQGREGYPELVTIISTLEESAAAHEQLAWNTLTDGDDQEEERRNWGQFVKRPMEPMDPTYELFGTSFTACLSDGLTVLGGGPGMGKTVALRRLLAQWATSQAETGPEAFYPQFHFALYFELGRGTEEPCSLESLVTRAYPHLGRLLPYLWQTPESLLLVFDGLERLKGWPEGATGSSLMEPQDEAAVPALLWAMCQGRLLAGCTLLICGRHQALRPFQQTGVQLWVEAAGLGEASRRAYAAGLAPRRGEPPSTALERAQGQSDYLRGLCREPAYCWLVCCSPLDPTEGPLPRTTTQLLATYLRGALREEQQAPGGLPGLVSRLGDLALEGLAQRTLRFREEDFRRHGLEASSLGRGLVQRVGQAYAFPQPPLQEFLAALAQYLAEDGRSLLELLHAAHGSDDGRYQGYLRFLLGLSSRSSSRALEGLLPPLPHRAVCDAILWLEGLVQSEGKKREVSRRRLLNVAHYLHEARNQRLARQLARSVSRLPLGSEKPQAGIRLDPPDCAALAYVFRHCESIDTFSFDNCYVQAEGIRHLLPAFLNCKRIR